MFNVQQITSRLSMMSDAQLAQYARMHKDDPYILPLASAEAKRRQQTRQGATGQQAMQQATQPTVADRDIAAMQLPEDQGIGVLPAQNIEGMADGGIAGYATGGAPQSEREKYRAYALRKAREMGLDPKFVDGIFQIESGYDPTAKSKTGPEGIGQLAKKTGLAKGLKPEERKDPYKNMDAAMSLMKDFFNKYKDPAKVAIAYNQGEGVLNDHLKKNKGKLVPEKLHESVRTRNKQEPLNYLKKLNNYIPIPAAAAADMPPRGEPKVSPSSDTPATRGITALPTIPKPAAAPAAAPVKPKAAAPVADEAMYTPEGIPLIAPPGGPETKAPTTALLTGTADLFLGIPEAITNVVTQDYYVATGKSPTEARRAAENNPAVKAAGMLRSGKWFGVENDPAYRKDPLSVIASLPAMGVDGIAEKFGLDKDAAQLALNNALLVAPAIGKVKQVQYNMPKLPGKEPPTLTPELAQNAVKQALDEVRTAETKTAAPRLPAPTTETPGAVRVTPEGIGVLPTGEAAASKKAGLAGLAEDQLALSAAKRKLAEAEAIAAASSKVPGKSLAERFGALPFTGRAAAPYGALAATTDISGRGAETPEVQYPDISENMYPTEQPKGEETAPTTPDKLDAAKALAEEVTPKTGGLSNEDILTMGLNMMMAQPGQPGGALSQLASNVGRSGIATLQSRREREKLEQERAYKDIYSKYLKAQTEQFGRKPEDIRSLEELLKRPELMQVLAKKQIYGDITGAQARLIGEFQKARQMNPMMTWDEFIRDVPQEYLPGGGVAMGFPQGVTVTRRPE